MKHNIVLKITLNKFSHFLQLILLSSLVVFHSMQDVYAGIVEARKEKQMQKCTLTENNKTKTHSAEFGSHATRLATAKQLIEHWVQPNNIELLISHLKNIPNQWLTQHDTALDLGSATKVIYINSLDGLDFNQSPLTKNETLQKKYLVILSDDLIQSEIQNITEHISSVLSSNEKVSEENPLIVMTQEKQWLENLSLKSTRTQNSSNGSIILLATNILRNITQVLKNPFIALSSFLVTPSSATLTSESAIATLSVLGTATTLILCCFFGVVFLCKCYDKVNTEVKTPTDCNALTEIKPQPDHLTSTIMYQNRPCVINIPNSSKYYRGNTSINLDFLN